MASDASISRQKDNRTTQERGAVYTGLLVLNGIGWFIALIASFFIWGYAAIDFGIDLLDIANKVFDPATVVDPLTVIVNFATVLALLVPIIFSAWALANVIDAWRMNIEGYRNVLTLAVGQVLIAIIIFVNIPATIASIVFLIILIAVAHFKFYPEYRGMPIADIFSDLRFIRVFWQVFFVAVIIFVAKFLVISVYDSLLANNLTPSFEFLFLRAGFGINQSPDWYSADARYGDAFLVGVVNTLTVVSLGLVFATIMGVLLGIFLLNQNWLVRTISRTYVEILRNTPLLLQLVFWYFVFWLSLPSTNVSFPNESIMVVALRYFPYLFAFIGAAIFVWRFIAPGRLFNGFLTGFVIAELAFWLLGDSYFVIIVLGLLGAVAIVLANRENMVPSSYVGLIQGTGAMLVVQLAGHLLLDGLSGAGIIDNARVVYGEVVPLFIFGPNVFALPFFGLTPNFTMFAIITVVGLVVAIGLYIYWGNIIERTGADIPRTVYATVIVLLVMVIGWNIASRPISEDLQIDINGETVSLSQAREEGLLEDLVLELYDTEQPVLVQAPELNRFGTRVLNGASVSPNYAALLVGLVVYTYAYIGEIVRAGIQAVPWGQVEAARALGLSTPQTLRMIILPQALRVIIPPLGNQYLNLSKNSSLATAIAFSDTYQIGQTIMNQSGQSITGFFLILVVYLILSLLISLVMNFVNSRFQLVTR